MKGVVETMSTNDTMNIFQLTSNFINKLSQEQQENLLNGNAEIEYCETREFRFNNRLKKQILRCSNISEIEKVYEGMFKRGIISFCQFYGINVSPRDTKQTLYLKIAHYYNIEIKVSKNNRR